MTLKQAVKDIIANADESLSDGEVLDLIMEELDKEHDEDNRYQEINIVGANILQKNYETVTAAMQLKQDIINQLNIRRKLWD